MNVDYNSFAKTFSNSRKNMRWEEIEYFISFLELEKRLNILDVGCGNGRLLGVLKNSNLDVKKYLGVDLSKGLLDEARSTYPKSDFLELNMLNIDSLDESIFDNIFFIASFHHLQSIEDRIEVLKKAYKLLDKGGKLFMTNWALNSEFNKKRYKTSIINGSCNEFGSEDYRIKIGVNFRYYHCFNLKELKYLFKKTGFEVIENREFDNKKNFISIIKKI